jgi:epoxyqueuosine reductase
MPVPADNAASEDRLQIEKNWLRERARAAGFNTFGVAAPDGIPHAPAALRNFLDAGRHGEMQWLTSRAEERSDPRKLWPDVRAIVMLGINYGPETDPLDALNDARRGAISVYAQGRDYHDVIKGKLKAIAGEFSRRFGWDVKVFVDTAPVMEKPLAEAAGLGWQGKHTNLVSRRCGSWLFLGAIYTTAPLQPDRPEDQHCGTCSRCLDICPTAAFPAAFQLNATRCISYLTIEHKSQIGREFRAAIGNRIYGCDDCLAVCPWNKFAQTASEMRLTPRASSANPPLAELLALDDAAFRARFAGTPIKRTGVDRFMRNVLIATGNSCDASHLHHVLRHLKSASWLVRGMAVWAAARLLGPESGAFRALYSEHYAVEDHPSVRAEWEAETRA